MGFLSGDKNSYDSLSRSGRNKRGSLKGVLLLAIFLAVVGGASVKGIEVYRFSRLLSKARSHLDEGHLDQAQRSLNLALAESPQSPVIYEGLAIVALEEGNFNKAKERLALALSFGSRPNRKFSLVQIAEDYIDKGQYKESEMLFEQANRIRPNKIDILEGLGLCYQARGYLPGAIAQFRTALDLRPDSKKLQGLLDQAHLEDDKTNIDYMFDRNGKVLARWKLRSSSGRRSIFPAGPALAHVLGWSYPSNDKLKRGQKGIEGAFQGQFPGNKLYLTIDVRLQNIVYKALGNYVGAIVALKPSTGEILAMISQPTFAPAKISDPSEYKRYQENPFKPFQHRAIESVYDGGSISKIVTAASVINRNLDLSGIFPVRCRKYNTVASEPVNDWMAHKTVSSLSKAFVHSCNYGFARVGQVLGYDGLLDMFNTMAFNRDIPMVPKSMVVTPSTALTSHPSVAQLARAAAGLGDATRISPLHAALIAAAIANDGEMIFPRLVRELKNIRGDVIESYPGERSIRIMKSSTAEELTKMMVKAVISGTGRRAAVKNVAVAGKTATAGYRDDIFGRFHAWFLCFAPAKKPEIAIAVFLEHGGTGKDQAAPVAREVLRKFFALESK